MKYYRCYLLTADDHIAKAQILKCAHDEDAKRQCIDVFIDGGRFCGAEIWDGARRVCTFPEDLAASNAKAAPRRGEQTGRGDKRRTRCANYR